MHPYDSRASALGCTTSLHKYFVSQTLVGPEWTSYVKQLIEELKNAYTAIINVRASSYSELDARGTSGVSDDIAPQRVSFQVNERYPINGWR